MKKTGITSVAAILLLAGSAMVSCGENATVRAQRELIDSLENANWQKQLDYQDLQRNLTVIAAGLDSIAVEEGKMFFANGDFESRSVNRQRARQNLAYVRDLLARHRRRIVELENQLQEDNANTRMLKTIITSLREQLDSKDRELARLRRDLDDNRKNIAALTQQVQQMGEEQKMQAETIQQQQQTITRQQDQLNIAYIRIGTKQELKRLGLLSGGFLKKKRVDYANIDLGSFRKVDIRSTKTIALPGKVKILTAVPADSYRLTKEGSDGCTLSITDVEKFWSVSNFLIIQTN